MFKDGKQAALFLLKDVVSTISGNLDFIVVRGWAPLLRCNGSLLHPGTNDVDVLLSPKTTSHALEKTQRLLIMRGYMPSAKHPFQLGKALPIEGGPTFLYNVDFMHPEETSKDFELFADHFEWPAYVNIALQKKFPAKSIALPSSALLFEGFWSYFSVPHNEGAFQVPLLSDVGILLTKAASFTNKKRPRDSFDIFFIIYNHPNTNSFRDLIQTGRSNPVADTSLNALEEDLKNFNDFNKNVAKYCDGQILKTDNPKQFVLDFLKDTQINKI
jgi:hypothetical protein